MRLARSLARSTRTERRAQRVGLGRLADKTLQLLEYDPAILGEVVKQLALALE